MAERQVRGVFINYRRKTTGPNGETIVGLASASRGDRIDTDSLADGELDRLERSAGLMPAGQEVAPEEIEAVLARALNPLDVTREDFGAPVSVSPPGMGMAPRGDFTTGDTGVDPADNPPPLETGTVLVDAGSGQEGSLLRTDAPDVDDTAALSQFIADERLNAQETVALAEGDPERAKAVLEAEKAATGQDPRKSVAEPLQKIIDQGNGGE